MRKKLRTRAAIEQAAFALFEDQGYEGTTVEQIAEQAEVSTTTFFRYFPSKADLVVFGSCAQVPMLIEDMLNRPADDAYLAVIRDAVLAVWVPEIDPASTLAAARAARQCPQLRGIYENVSRGWVVEVADALAKRRNLPKPDQMCNLAARVGMGIFGGAVERWVTGECAGDLAKIINDEFAAAFALCSEGNAPSSQMTN